MNSVLTGKTVRRRHLLQRMNGLTTRTLLHTTQSILTIRRRTATLGVI